ncbi:MAG: DsbA family oxidoreductase [Lutibacter sp.]|uniref:DsbA family oxidoreductase n=1 Tax=Lutibacter sp. TaxID=1925666 RepID=UPI0018425C47|nr:DsbA family oxidoreductase [Lutibacter sp.]MBT8317682.1 DsbA family oxidoreductase [Lutibacter sp.]NNJ58540.1 DsbA family oxidoreductase [Lutibacter sp.]
MKEKIKIDIVSDVVCPWCIIGYKRLEKAIAEMGIQDNIELDWQPFELNPAMPKEGQNVIEHITEKYGSSLEDQKISKQQMIENGAELGFTFDYFDAMRMVNTRDAHILLDFAKEQRKQTELNLKYVAAFFSNRKDISDRTILLEELEKIGLDKNEAILRLESENVRNKVIEEENTWKNIGVNSVPTFLFNRKSALSGAQPVNVFKQVLTQVLNEQQQQQQQQ